MAIEPVIVISEPWEHGLVLHVDGVGVTQTHNAYPNDTAETMVRDMVSDMLEVPESSFDVVIIPLEHVRRAIAAIDELRKATTDCDEIMRSFNEAFRKGETDDSELNLAETPDDGQGAETV